MKQNIKHIMALKTKDGRKMDMRATLFMIMAFIAFWGVSFYLLVNSNA